MSASALVFRIIAVDNGAATRFEAIQKAAKSVKRRRWWHALNPFR